VPCLRHTSAVFAPASCSCRIAMICSSLNRLRFIVRPPSGGRTLLKSGGASGAQVICPRPALHPSAVRQRYRRRDSGYLLGERSDRLPYAESKAHWYTLEDAPGLQPLADLGKDRK